jgi:hypothetical protein
MVFTVAMRSTGVSRRQALRMLGAGAVAAAAGPVLAGCDWFAEKPPPPDVLEPFYQATVDLADRYDAIIAAVPAIGARITPLRDHHRAHLAKLVIVMKKKLPSSPPTPAPSAVASLPTAETAAFTDLLGKEKAALDAASAACLAAATAERATLLGEITACRATHVEVLK